MEPCTEAEALMRGGFTAMVAAAAATISVFFMVMAILGLPGLPLPPRGGPTVYGLADFRENLTEWSEVQGFRYSYWTWVWLSVSVFFGLIGLEVALWRRLRAWMQFPSDDSPRVLIVLLLTVGVPCLIIGGGPLALSVFGLRQSNYAGGWWSVPDAAMVATLWWAPVVLFGAYIVVQFAKVKK